ncbi:TIGR00730 family Rossman fold protein [Leyella stercorea]|uniref:Cytokinin riboside 5'-monophosphate phosphoribohydrolase n=1 Tax=Leyella stercorea TaxID=363265 RepID=A0A3R6FKL0_9BACT|nr:TIGR00730 family Rossman fold protein [Leyella stercorea]RHK50695.1 TIGR00730 family Rossman fold protein [Leyella stercorea]
MNICIFCSANSNIPTEYFERTSELGTWMGANGHTLVFGGCNLGLMECVAKAVHDAKGMTVGVVPTIVEKGGKVSDYVDVKILCDNLSDRKDLMIERSDVIIALPGGVGTLDEIFTVLAAASIGYHSKRVILYNIGGFWDSLIAMLDDLKTRGVLRAGFEDTVKVAHTLDEIAALIAQ